MALSEVTGGPGGKRAWLLLSHDPGALSHVSWSYGYTCGRAYGSPNEHSCSASELTCDAG